MTLKRLKKTKTWIFSSCWRSSACSSCDCCSCPEKIPCQWPSLGRILKKKWEHTPYSGDMEKKTFLWASWEILWKNSFSLAWSTFVRFGKIWRQGAPHLELAPPPPRAFLGAFEATVLLAPPSPFVRTIFRLLLVFSEKHQYCHFLVCLHHLPSFCITIQHYCSTACIRTIFESLIFC